MLDVSTDKCINKVDYGLPRLDLKSEGTSFCFFALRHLRVTPIIICVHCLFLFDQHLSSFSATSLHKYLPCVYLMLLLFTSWH